MNLKEKNRRKKLILSNIKRVKKNLHRALNDVKIHFPELKRLRVDLECLEYHTKVALNNYNSILDSEKFFS